MAHNYSSSSVAHRFQKVGHPSLEVIEIGCKSPETEDQWPIPGKLRTMWEKQVGKHEIKEAGKQWKTNHVGSSAVILSNLKLVSDFEQWCDII